MDKIKTTMYEYENKVMPYLIQIRNDAVINDQPLPVLKVLNNLKEYGFLFDKFNLYVDNLLFKVENDKDVFFVKAIDLENHMGLKTIFSIDEWLDNDFRTKNITSAPEGVLHITTEAGEILLFIIFYIMVKAINQEVVLIDETKKIYQQDSIKKFSRSRTSQDNEYTLDQIIYKYAKHINHCKHNITCDHWTVRGHYRHYKDGKVVYVKPYDKGKNKDVDIKDKVWNI